MYFDYLAKYSLTKIIGKVYFAKNVSGKVYFAAELYMKYYVYACPKI